jgi:hypothetical protein
MLFPLATLPSEAHPIVWRSLIGVTIIANITWYLAKYVLKTHGFAVSFIWHARDVPNLFRLARRETDPAKRFGYFSLFVAQWVSGLTFVALGVYLFTHS